MHTLQHQMPTPVDLGTPLLRRTAPCEEHDAPRPLQGDGVDDFLRELFPALLRMAIGFVCADSQTGIEKQDAAVCPGSEKAASFGRFFEGWVIVFERDVHVLE